jgi:hypothetical protein
VSSIDDIRAILAASNERVEEILGAFALVAQAVEENKGRLYQVAGGSTQAAIQEAMGLYAQVADAIDPLMGMVIAARSSVDTYAASL